MNLTVTDSDVAIYYEITGKGYPLVLLHGQYMNTTMFDTFEKELKKEYQLIKIDLRGHGHSDKPLHITMSDYVEDVITVLNELYIRQANFIGYGLGGMVTEAIAINHPELVQRMVLVSVGNESIDVSREKFESQYGNILRTLDRNERSKVLEEYMYHDYKKVKRWKKSLNDTESTMTNLEINAIDHSTTAQNLLEEAHHIKAPTLIISGAHDHLIQPDNGETLSRRIENSTYMLFDKSGHAPMIEEKERFLQDVMTFLSPSLSI